MKVSHVNITQYQAGIVAPYWYDKVQLIWTHSLTAKALTQFVFLSIWKKKIAKCSGIVVNHEFLWQHIWGKKESWAIVECHLIEKYMHTYRKAAASIKMHYRFYRVCCTSFNSLLPPSRSLYFPFLTLISQNFLFFPSLPLSSTLKKFLLLLPERGHLCFSSPFFLSTISCSLCNLNYRPVDLQKPFLTHQSQVLDKLTSKNSKISPQKLKFYKTHAWILKSSEACQENL